MFYLWNRVMLLCSVFPYRSISNIIDISTQMFWSASATTTKAVWECFFLLMVHLARISSIHIVSIHIVNPNKISSMSIWQIISLLRVSYIYRINQSWHILEFHRNKLLLGLLTVITNCIPIVTSQGKPIKTGLNQYKFILHLKKNKIPECFL